MNRTSKLMTTVLASALLNGAEPSPLAATEEDQRQEANQSATNQEVSDAANRIYDWLPRGDPSKAKSVDEIMLEFPQFKSALVEQAIKYLIDHGSLKRLGSGTKDEPYRYYTSLSHGG
jgi:hypothetical protein